ncbi:shematrin-like protein 1 [Nilaparvata lugens]|uniref:shematrin-like protein 1 n=1 Tax=Nilaparvata lugens TaxID=108931 RepID=UPI00193E3FF5|nr:shematrin-like protein 1 [Nilaparvata lugens]
MGHRLNLAFVILALATLLPAQESSAQALYYGPAAYDGTGFDQGFGPAGAGYGPASLGYRYGQGYYPFGRGYSKVSPPWAGSPFQTGPGTLRYSPSLRLYDSGSYTYPNGLGGHDTVRTTGYDTKRSYFGYGASSFGYNGEGGPYGPVASVPGEYYGAVVAPGSAGYYGPNFGAEPAYPQALAY